MSCPSAQQSRENLQTQLRGRRHIVGWLVGGLKVGGIIEIVGGCQIRVGVCCIGGRLVGGGLVGLGWALKCRVRMFPRHGVAVWVLLGVR